MKNRDVQFVRHTLVLFLIVCIAGCDSNSLVDLDQNELAGVNLSGGIHRKQVSLGGGSVMRYTVSVPQLTPGVRYPLIVALHQAGTRVPWMSEPYLRGQVEPALRDLHAIIIAPDVQGASWVDPISVETVTDLISAIIKLDRSWPVDPDRIVITGYSAGGIGTWFFTLEHAHFFSAGIPVAAEPIVGDRRGSSAVPLFVIHGDQDEIFSYNDVRTDVESLQNEGVPIRLETAAGISHSDLQAYQPALKKAAEWLVNDVWN